MTSRLPASFRVSLLAVLATSSAGSEAPDPLPSPDGALLLSPYTTADPEGVEVWVIRITDSTGRVLMDLLGPDACSGGDLYRAWDDTGRAWIYFEPWQEIMCFASGPGGWTMVCRRDAGTIREGYDPPDDLYPPLPGSSAGGQPGILPGILIEESGPGWEYSLSCPEIPADLGFIRDLVVESMTAMKNDFSSYAEADFAEWGDDPGFMTWILEAFMSLPPAPDGMLTASCSWWDYSGGAHGNTGYSLWRFERDGTPGGPVPWAGVGTRDILADSAELVALSTLVTDSLSKVLGECSDIGWIMEGAGPEWGNYELLIPVPDSSGALAGFSIHFPAYSVAPYVAGPQDVFIPIGLLRP